MVSEIKRAREEMLSTYTGLEDKVKTLTATNQRCRRSLISAIRPKGAEAKAA